MKLRDNKGKLILSSLLTFLPMIAGLLLWKQLPEQVPTHWNANGEVDGYSSRALAVFGLPLFLLAIHWLCLVVTTSDKNNDKQTGKVLTTMFWICPLISLFGGATIYGTILGYQFDMTTLPCVILGIMFLVIGNYLPKCRHNYTIGIKLPWTLASEENWNATHRFSGKVWVIGGFAVLLLVFLPKSFSFPCIMATLIGIVLIPTVYSYLYMKKHG